ncbi:hypothetical protein AB0G67_48590 [Streptomyces sp. NPDC021056]|uniref:hypothetical protein n=1 Tax=Streptomyces sp. NPDC021056 TaxID=3155012 RepID=UPI0033CE08AF
MDADESRPARRRPAAADKRVPVRRPRKLARPDLDPGPQQQVRDLLHDLHEKAGRPALEKLERRIAGDDRLDGAPKKDLIHRVISRGGPAALDDVRAVARTLARACGQDEYTIAAQVTQMMGSSDRPPSPGPLLVSRSAYLAQVRQIAPAELRDREPEWDELAVFCRSDDEPRYAWWRGGAWTGKTALMSSFALAPPPGLLVIPFFVTRRFAGNNDRAAFIRSVNAQLAAALGRAPLPGEPEQTFYHLLTEVAGDCRRCGQRLILLVDGLDEDVGASVGNPVLSIAALLPISLPADMRVLVAGRPDPPLPADVPDDHPLRRPDIVHTLSRSPHARAARAEMQEDLDRLRDGTTLEQDLLGLVATAGGGLSSADLAELCSEHDTTDWAIDRILSTLAGRSFARRAMQWRAAGQVYVLGHEEIQNDAVRSIGPRRLLGYRQRLDRWADRHRDRGWIENTPEYLLRGYFQLLAGSADLDRLVDYATDRKRHDRMLDLSGGDTTAVAEVAEAQGILLRQPTGQPELMVRLAVHRARLAERNDDVAIILAPVWASFGRIERAEQLARGLPDRRARAEALSRMAGVLAESGQLDEAERIALDIPDDRARSWVVARLAVLVARSGNLVGAEDLAQAAPELPDRIRTLTQLARIAAESGERARANTLIDSAQSLIAEIPDEPDRDRDSPRLRASVQVAEMAARLGDVDRAQRVVAGLTVDGDKALEEVIDALAQVEDVGGAGDLADVIERIIPDLPSGRRRFTALVRLAGVVAQAGDIARARVLAATAERLIHSFPNDHDHDQVLVELAGLAARTGDLDGAEQIVRDVTGDSMRSSAAMRVAEVVAPLGDRDRVRRLATYVIDDSARARALARLAELLALHDDLDGAEQLLRDITDDNDRAWILAHLAGVMAAIGDRNRAGRLADTAEDLIRDAAQHALRPAALVRPPSVMVIGTGLDYLTPSATESYRGSAVAWLIQARMRMEDFDAAELLIGAIPDDAVRAWAVAGLASRVGRAGDLDRARALAETAERTARSIVPDYWSSSVIRLIEMLTTIGHSRTARELLDTAERLARNTRHESLRTPALLKLADLAAALGDRERADALALAAERLALEILDNETRTYAVMDLIDRACEAEDLDHAEHLARTIPASVWWFDSTDPIRDSVFAKVAKVAGQLGRAEDLDRAERLVREIDQDCERALAMAQLVDDAAEADDLCRAERLAQDIPDGRYREMAAAHLATPRPSRPPERPVKGRTSVPLTSQIRLSGETDRESARRMLTQSLASDTWANVGLIVAEAFPSVVLALADQIQRSMAD